jgi:hypothetical protein
VPERKVHSNHVRTAQDSADSDLIGIVMRQSPNSREGSHRRHTYPMTTQGVTVEADEDGPPGTSVPELTHRASSTHRSPASTQSAAKKRASQQRPFKRRGMSARLARLTASKMHIVGLTSSGVASKDARRPLQKRKRLESTNMWDALDTG